MRSAEFFYGIEVVSEVDGFLMRERTISIPQRRAVTAAVANRCRDGFTLIELLVVITMIATLVALLLPAIKRARASAVAVMCAENERQMHLVFYNFAVESEHRVLPSGHWGESVVGIAPPMGQYQGDEYGVWPEQLVDYGMTIDLVQCPAVNNIWRQVRRSTWYYGWPGKKGFDYVYRGGYGNHSYAPNGYYWQDHGYFLGPGRVVDASGQPLAASDVVYLSDIAYNSDVSYPGWYYGGFGFIDPSNHHRGEVWQAEGSNRLYADGHVEWYRIREQGHGTPGYWCHDYYTNYY